MGRIIIDIHQYLEYNSPWPNTEREFVAHLSDPDRLAAYQDALSNWRCTDFICFELNETAYRWLRSELDGITTDELGRLMWEYVEGGGKIHEVRETREIWSDDYEFHYDLKIMIQNKAVYIETRLIFSPPFAPDKASILVVNIHDQ